MIALSIVSRLLNQPVPVETLVTMSTLLRLLNPGFSKPWARGASDHCAYRRVKAVETDTPSNWEVKREVNRVLTAMSETSLPAAPQRTSKPSPARRQMAVRQDERGAHRQRTYRRAGNCSPRLIENLYDATPLFRHYFPPRCDQ
jgi:hypothetical protein